MSTVIRKVKTSKANVALLIKSQSIGGTVIFVEQKTIIDLETGDYYLETGQYQAGGETITSTRVCFEVEGIDKTVKIWVRPRTKINDDEDCRIALFEATRDEDFGGKLKTTIEKGDKRTYAIQ